MGTWGSAPRKEEKKSSREKDRKSGSVSPTDEKRSKDAEVKRSKSSRKADKEDKGSSKDSSSDKAEKSSKADRDSRPPKSRGLSAMFANPPPLERRASTGGKSSSRRRSLQVDDSGLISPPPEDGPPVSSKAAKLLGINQGKLSRSKSERTRRTRDVTEDDDIVMVGADDDPTAAEKNREHKRKPKSKNEDDIVMVDGDGPSENVGQAGLKRSDSSAKKITAGLGGMFGGLLSKSRPEPKRRSTYLTDDEGARGLRREDRKVQREGRTPSGGDANSADGPITDADA